MKRTLYVLAAIAAAAFAPARAADELIDFEDFPLAPESHYFPAASVDIAVGGASFNHAYDDLYGSWSGWTISNRSDIVTPGYENQFSAYATSDAGQNNYALAYAAIGGWGATPAITFDAPTQVNSAFITNATYGALSMLNGDSFGKVFGGASGNDPDYFVLSISGHDSGGAVTGTVDFYLADFRFDDSSLDYIVSDWAEVDLSPLGEVASLTFQVDSSDISPYGINTPAYFALDRLSIGTPVPWPATPWLYGAGLALVGALRRRRRMAS